HEVEHRFDRMLALGAEVIEEDAADATSLVAMWQEEVIVTPRLEAVVVADRRVTVAGLREGPVEVLHILPKEIVRREICTTAEPECVALRQTPEVRMRSRNHRGAR